MRYAVVGAAVGGSTSTRYRNSGADEQSLQRALDTRFESTLLVTLAVER